MSNDIDRETPAPVRVERMVRRPFAWAMSFTPLSSDAFSKTALSPESPHPSKVDDRELWNQHVLERGGCNSVAYWERVTDEQLLDALYRGKRLPRPTVAELGIRLASVRACRESLTETQRFCRRIFRMLWDIVSVFRVSCREVKPPNDPSSPTAAGAEVERKEKDRT